MKMPDKASRMKVEREKKTKPSTYKNPSRDNACIFIIAYHSHKVY
jgi:hypothetical protein